MLLNHGNSEERITCNQPMILQQWYYIMIKYTDIHTHKQLISQILTVYECEGWNNIHEVKVRIVPFHEPVDEWNGQYMSNFTRILKTVNICFISLLHKFYNINHNFILTFNWLLLQKFTSFGPLYCGLKLSWWIGESYPARASLKKFDSICFQNVHVGPTIKQRQWW